MVSKPNSMLQAEMHRLREENERLRSDLDNLKRFVTALQSLSEATERFKTHDDLVRLLSDIVLLTLDLLNAPDGSLLLLAPETNELEFVIVHGAARDQLIGKRLPANEGIAGWVVSSGKTLIVRDARTDPRFSSRMDDETKFRTQSIAAAPLWGDSRVLGVIEVVNQPGDKPFNDLDQALMTLFCRFAGQALSEIEKAELHEAK